MQVMVPSYLPLAIRSWAFQGSRRHQGRPQGHGGSRLSPSGSGRITMMEGRSLNLLVKPLMPDVYPDPERGKAGRGICPCCSRKFVRSQLGIQHSRAVARMTLWLGSLMSHSHKAENCLLTDGRLR